MNNATRYAIFAGIAVLLAAGAYFLGTVSSPNNGSNSAQTNTNAGNTNTNSSTEVTLTLGEVAKHSKQSDCWLIISDKVYNATNWIALHPGGPEKIIPNCGKDATEQFSTKDGTGLIHSSTALTILRGLYLGDLGATVTR